MRVCDFLNKIKPRFASGSKEAFALSIFSALCDNNAPVGLTGDDATYRKLLFSGDNKKYKGLSKPIKAHIQANANKTTFIAYCESNVSVEDFKALCADFGVSADAGRALVFEGVFGMFMEFAKSNADSVSDTFVADFVTDRLMNPPTEIIETKEAETAPICAGDDFRLIRQSPTQPHKATFYDELTHHWVIKNSGVAIWDGRYMDFVNAGETPLKLKPEVTHIDIKKTPPNGEVTISVIIEARHIEGTHEIILDMKDSEGRLCFPDKRAELRLPVTVGWTK